MKEAKMYSFMADEARDGHTEQLAVCVSFVSCKGHIKECFLGLRKLERFDAQCITDSIEELLLNPMTGHLSRVVLWVACRPVLDRDTLKQYMCTAMHMSSTLSFAIHARLSQLLPTSLEFWKICTHFSTPPW